MGGETMMVTEKRLSDIEIAITELTILNKHQAEAAQKQSEHIDHILEYLRDVAVLKDNVNTIDSKVDQLSTKVNHLFEQIEMKEEKMQREINNNKDELNTMGANRFLRSLLIAGGMVGFMFGYLYIDLHTREIKVDEQLTRINDSLKKHSKYYYRIDDIYNMIKTHSKEK